MDKLRAFLNSLTTREQFFFAQGCGTTIAYLRKRCNPNAAGRFSRELATAIERKSGRKVLVKDICPDSDVCRRRAPTRPRNRAA